MNASLNFRAGEVIFNHLESIFNNDQHTYNIPEDLLQVCFINNFMIDVSWHPFANSKGYFIIYAIQNYNWDRPFLKFKTNDNGSLLPLIQVAIDKVAFI